DLEVVVTPHRVHRDAGRRAVGGGGAPQLLGQAVELAEGIESQQHRVVSSWISGSCRWSLRPRVTTKLSVPNSTFLMLPQWGTSSTIVPSGDSSARRTVLDARRVPSGSRAANAPARPSTS